MEAELHITGLVADHRQFWTAPLPFQRLMLNARRGLRSALSRLANEPGLWAHCPSEAPADEDMLPALLERVKNDRRQQIDDTHPSQSEEARAELYGQALSLLPDRKVVLARLHEYNELIKAFNQSLAAVREAQTRGDDRRRQEIVAHFIRMHAAEVA